MKRLVVCLVLLVVVGAVFAIFKTEERNTLIEQMPGQVTHDSSGFAQVYGHSGPDLAQHDRWKISGSTFDEATEVAKRCARTLKAGNGTRLAQTSLLANAHQAEFTKLLQSPETTT